MADQTSERCERCRGSRGVRFCRDCTSHFCSKCLVVTEVPKWFCASCTVYRPGEVCGSCGSDCHIANYVEEATCPSCKSTRLGDPQTLLNNLPSDFFTVVSKTKSVAPEIADLYRSFDFLVALVRFCRLAGFLGFPQMEQQLEKCSGALLKINQRSIKQLNQIRQEALYDLRRLDYLQDFEIVHFRNAESVIQSTDEKIDRLIINIRHWIAEVKVLLDQLKPLAFFLRKHYDLLAEINRYMPDGLDDVAAIVPPIPLSISFAGKTDKGDNYIIFAEEHCVFLPSRAVGNNDDVIVGIKVPYDQLLDKSRNSSLLKGTQLVLKLHAGEVIINAPPQVLDRVEEYFGLIYANEPYMVGSAKKIIQIESDTPDKNEYKRSSQKFTEIFREWLFGDPVQRPDEPPMKLPSMKELMSRLNTLEHQYRDINYRASNHQIDIDEYQSMSSSIKRDFDNIRSSLHRLGGHLGKNLDPKYSSFS